MARLFLPGPRRRLGPVIKCRRFLSFFQRCIVRDISLTWDILRARYFWECSLAHWNLIRHFEKHEAWRTVKRKIITFLGNDSFPNLYDALVYERRFMSEYLERPGAPGVNNINHAIQWIVIYPVDSVNNPGLVEWKAPLVPRVSHCNTSLRFHRCWSKACNKACMHVLQKLAIPKGRQFTVR